VRTHLGLMVFYAAMTGLFFALLWKRERNEQIRVFIMIFLSLVVGGIVAGWLMFPFPQK
jgi:uncharacterized membrane protein YwzB